MAAPEIAAEPIATRRLRLEPLRVADAEEMVGVLADPTIYRVIGGHPPTLPALRSRYERMTVGRSPDGTQAWLNWVVRLAGRPDPSGSADGAASSDASDPGPATAGGVAVGTVQATVLDDGSADVAWVFAPAWQGRGYAGESAAAMVVWLLARGVEVVTAHVHPDHQASAGVARRAGLRPTDRTVDGEVRWIRP